MDATQVSEIAIVAILAVICLVASFIYRGRAKVKINAPFNMSLDLDASNNTAGPTGGARSENAKSRSGGATAQDSTGKGASINRTEVEGDLRAEPGSPLRQATQKPGPRTGARSPNY